MHVGSNGFPAPIHRCFPCKYAEHIVFLQSLASLHGGRNCSSCGLSQIAPKCNIFDEPACNPCHTLLKRKARCICSNPSSSPCCHCLFGLTSPPLQTRISGSFCPIMHSPPSHYLSVIPTPLPMSQPPAAEQIYLWQRPESPLVPPAAAAAALSQTWSVQADLLTHLALLVAAFIEEGTALSQEHWEKHCFVPAGSSWTLHPKGSLRHSHT